MMTEPGYCQCGCGQLTTIATRNSTRIGMVKGQPRRFVLGHGRASHRMSHSKTYNTWMAMRWRCSNPDNVKWALYGGRGITVCDRWQNSFEAFLADMGERPEGKTIDRIDPDGNYEPGNCRWATAVEQRANMRVPSSAE